MANYSLGISHPNQFEQLEVVFPRAVPPARSRQPLVSVSPTNVGAQQDHHPEADGQLLRASETLARGGVSAAHLS